MRNYIVFLKKELMEFVRTKKFLGLTAVFFFFAITSPLLARYMIEFLTALMPAEDAHMLLNVPDPVWIDSYRQFYSQMTQIGALAVTVLFMGAISYEKQQGTADLVITKGLGTISFVLSKFTLIALAILITMIVSVLIVFGYTAVLFDEAGNLGQVLTGALLYGLFFIFVVSIILFCSSFAKTAAISALFSFLLYILFTSFGSLPVIGRFLPSAVTGNANAITSGYTSEVEGLVVAIVMTVVIIIFFLGMSILLLKRREGE